MNIETSNVKTTQKPEQKQQSKMFQTLVCLWANAQQQIFQIASQLATLLLTAAVQQHQTILVI